MLRLMRRWTAVSLLLAVPATPALAAGFSIFEQGSKAMGMAGAFTAQADDGSAMFHNVAGLAFQTYPDGKQRSYLAGVTLVHPSDTGFEGLPPFPGPGATGEQASNVFTIPHLYYVRPVNDEWTFGFGVESPFGLTTEWADPESWSGRFISTKGELRAVDLNPSLAWKFNDYFSLGMGAVIRFSDLGLEQYVGQRNPFNNRITDVGFADLESDMDRGYGWNVGLLYKNPAGFSWGFSYRSKVKVDYGGDGHLTQISSGNPIFDGAVAATIPFGQDLPIQTSIEFPDTASLGVAYAFSNTLLAEIDVNWTGWSTFDEVVFDFLTAPVLSQVIPEDYDDAQHYRLGVRVGPNGGRQWRFGVVYDETPQPDTSVGPLLPDADRVGYTIGYGNERFDLALMYLTFDERTTTTNDNVFNGTYQFTGVLLGGSVKF